MTSYKSNDVDVNGDSMQSIEDYKSESSSPKSRGSAVYSPNSIVYGEVHDVYGDVNGVEDENDVVSVKCTVDDIQPQNHTKIELPIQKITNHKMLPLIPNQNHIFLTLNQ